MLPIHRANLIASGLQAVQQALQESKARLADPVRQPPENGILTQELASRRSQIRAPSDIQRNQPSLLGSQLDCLL
jgi:hypothetical protein